MRKKLILIGGGGHCISTIGVVESTDLYEIIGILDSTKLIGDDVLGYKVVGNDNDIPFWVKQGAVFVITVGQVGSPALRRKIFNLVKMNNGVLPVIIASTAWVSPYALIGEGSIVFHKCVINAKTVIGENNIINTGAIIEHNTVLGNDNHISTAVTINGDCIIGNANFFGCGSIIHHRTMVSDNIILGAGTVVVKNCDEAGTYIGVPAKRIIK